MKKICTKCKENKALEDYYSHALTKDGKRSECKSCSITGQKRYDVEHKLQIAEYQQKYRAEHKQYISQ